jgi:hypothetical protein
VYYNSDDDDALHEFPSGKKNILVGRCCCRLSPPKPVGYYRNSTGCWAITTRVVFQTTTTPPPPASPTTATTTKNQQRGVVVLVESRRVVAYLRTVRPVYVVTGYVIFRYGVGYLIILKLVVQKSAPWMADMANDAEARRAARVRTWGKLYRWLFGTTTTTTTTTITTTTITTTTDYKDGVKTRSGRAVKVVAAAAVMAPL